MMAGIWEEDDMAVKLRKQLAIIAAVVLTLLFAVGSAVPAFAAEAVDTATDSNPQIAYEEPEFLNEERRDNFIILPDAPKKDGYIFSGWRVNGSTNLYSSGKEVSVKAGEKVTLTPVYCSDFLHVCAVMAYICFAIFFTLFVLRAFGDFSDKAQVVFNVLIAVFVVAFGVFFALSPSVTV